MGIKRGQHTIDSCLDQVLGFDFFNILRPNPLENISKEIKLFVDVAGRLGLLRQ